MSRPVRLKVQFLSRREWLRGAGATMGAVAVGACDRLVLPDGVSGELSPIVSNADFYVTSCCGTPTIDRDAWTLRFVDQTGGRADLLATVDLLEITGLPGREREHTLECIGANPSNQAIGNALWTGLPLTEVFEAFGVEIPASAQWLKMTGADDYSDTVPIADLDRPVWLVWYMNGETLPEEHGTTVRMLSPGRYGIKNPKWIVEIAFIDEPFLGYWEERGWSDDGTYLPNTFIASPGQSATVDAGSVRLLGTAFAGSDPIERIEVSLDGGQTWEDAEITYQNGPDVWTLWGFDWEATTGEWTIQVRATTASGAMSVEDPNGTDRYNGYDGSMQITVTVA